MSAGTLTKHFVVTYSPGTFVTETTQKEVPSWDVDIAVDICKSTQVRHNATPYGFRFITMSRGPDDLDSKQVKHSPMYYLGGIVETYEQVVARDDPKEKILRSNMKNNGYNRIITNYNSWKFTAPLDDDDVVLPFEKG